MYSYTVHTALAVKAWIEICVIIITYFTVLYTNIPCFTNRQIDPTLLRSKRLDYQLYHPSALVALSPSAVLNILDTSPWESRDLAFFILRNVRIHYSLIVENILSVEYSYIWPIVLKIIMEVRQSNNEPVTGNRFSGLRESCRKSPFRWRPRLSSGSALRPRRKPLLAGATARSIACEAPPRNIGTRIRLQPLLSTPAPAGGRTRVPAPACRRARVRLWAAPRRSHRCPWPMPSSAWIRPPPTPRQTTASSPNAGAIGAQLWKSRWWLWIQCILLGVPLHWMTETCYWMELPLLRFFLCSFVLGRHSLIIVVYYYNIINT